MNLNAEVRAPGYDETREVEDIPYGNPFWDPNFDQGSPDKTGACTEKRKQIRSDQVVPMNEQGSDGRRDTGNKLNKILPVTKVEQYWNPLWKKVFNDKVTEETFERIVVREETSERDVIREENLEKVKVGEYKRYKVVFRWAKCGPRWCGLLVKDTTECPHGTVLWLDQRPPGWSEDEEGWKEGTNPFQLNYSGTHYGRFDYFDNEENVPMRKEFAAKEGEQIKEVEWVAGFDY
ncbi:hypothetical protein J4E85_010262 [Alternaria conjuncta]|uniref:uncharacterized protein n=1 Tax=Alternaria conjuncta TaxID=181017 RepID=UPI00221EF752|nr:uncharacterized protein J4E85_010262 [Alternaria conjuncta]KAI4916174.1 hypothetical protein J4E85_010262 [Alternaria conjuncta]